MRLSIDCRYIGQSGIGTYIENIVDNLLAYHSEHQYVLICNKGMRTKHGANVLIVETDIKPFSLKELFAFPVEEINRSNAFFTPYINIPGRIKVPVFSVIHDVVFFDVDGLVSTIGKLLRSFYYKRAIKCSKKLFTVSEFSKERILHHFPTKKEIIVAYNGVPKKVLVYPTIDIQKKDYYIYVGNIKKHKGLHTLIKAYRQAVEQGLKSKLMVVGNKDKFRSADAEFDSLIDSVSGVEFTGRVNDETLLQLVSEAKALIQPSFYEGFGIPPLEAMCLGTNVILSNIQVFKEVYNDFPVMFFEVGNVENLTSVLLQFENHPFSTELKKKLMEKFSYKKNTDKIIETVV